jgi:hypothetical protein
MEQSAELGFVTELRENDVLLGRGRPAIEQNRFFRNLILANKEAYMSSSQHAIKGEISKNILSIIREKGGRFVRPISSDSERRRFGVPDEIRRAWVIVSDSVSIQKIKQALREQDAAQYTADESFHHSGTKRKSSSSELSTAVARWPTTQYSTTNKRPNPGYVGPIQHHETPANEPFTIFPGSGIPPLSFPSAESHRSLSSLDDFDFLTRLRSSANLNQSEIELRFQQQQALQQAILISQQARARLDTSNNGHGVQPNEYHNMIRTSNNNVPPLSGAVLEQHPWQMFPANQFALLNSPSSASISGTQMQQMSPKLQPSLGRIMDRVEPPEHDSLLRHGYSWSQKSQSDSENSRETSVADEEEKKPKSR